MANFIEFPQGSDDWNAHRQEHYNASDASAMLGKSSYKSRTSLLDLKHTGISEEVDAATQRRFDDGHKYEAIARPWAEELVGEELFPVVISDCINGLPLSASLDGVTLLEEITFEHKTLNSKLAKSLDDNVIPDEYHPQMEQQLLLSGANKCLFMASAGVKEDMRYQWYYSSPVVRNQIIAGWAQFDKDLKAYVHKPAAIVPEGRSPEALPALFVEVKGMVTASNLSEFKASAMAAIGGIKTDLQTDGDFADADKTAKWLKGVEDKLEAAKEHALSQTADIDALFKAIDAIKEDARAKRLDLGKLVKQRKERIKIDMVSDAKELLAEYLDSVEETLAGFPLPRVIANFTMVIKGKRTIESINNAIDTELARIKIETNSIADTIRANSALLDREAGEYRSLFADAAQLVLKDKSDLLAIIIARIAEHKKAEEERLALERKRIQAEEEAKAKRDAEAKADADRKRIRNEAREEQRKEIEAKAATKSAEEKPTPEPRRSPQKVSKIDAKDVSAPNSNASNAEQLPKEPGKVELDSTHAIATEAATLLQNRDLNDLSRVEQLFCALLEREGFLSANTHFNGFGFVGKAKSTLTNEREAS